MKLAETVTFGGGGRLDRAGALRGDSARLTQMLAHADTQVVPFWRGKPLVIDTDAGGLALLRLAVGHPVLQSIGGQRLFLGLEDSRPIWAQDISGWQPDDLDTATLDTFLDPTEQQHPDLPSGSRFAELRAIMTRLDAHECEVAATARAVLSWHQRHGFCPSCGAASASSLSGWQRDCAACETHHFPRTDPVVIMLITHGNDVLVGRSPGWPEGMYSLLAGFVEPGETLEAAVRREVVEEAGVAVGPVSYLASQPWPFPASLMFGCRGEAASREITIDPVEIEDALWVSRERMAAIFEGIDPQISAPRDGAIARFILWHWLTDQLD